MNNHQTFPASEPQETGWPEPMHPPATHVSRTEPANAPQSFQTNPPLRILVVEDDREIRRLSAEVLTRCGYDVDTAEDGAAAWSALLADSYDLMITDNNMPRLSGVELLKKMRGARMGLPVIMATGTVPTEQFAATPWLQPDATLCKPYAIEQLLGVVKKVLREANPSPGYVAAFAVANPQAKPVALIGEPAPAAVVSSVKAHDRILVVDEDSDLRVQYAGALDRLGFYVDVAHDGEAGWETLQAEQYHLLITENDMPNLTGVELVRKVRAAHMALPVIMAAQRLPTRTQLAGKPSLRLAATLLKPFPVAALVATVQTALLATDIARASVTPGPNGYGQSSPNGLRL
jgi:DNA-binding response OmpR family regulator